MSAGSPAQAEEAQLRAGVFVPNKTYLSRQAFDEFVDAVNAEGDGLVKIGPVVSNESVPAPDMPAALRSGVLDLIAVPPSYFAAFVPGAEGLPAARVSPETQRENGAWDLLNDALAERANVRLLAQYGAGAPLHVFTTFDVNGLDDLKDRRLGSSNTWKSFFEGAGIQAINTPVNDYYTAVERGVINGFANVNSILPALGLHEVVNYRIDPGFYSAVVVVAINLDTWEGLSEEQKAYLHEKALYLENQISASMAEKDAAIGAQMVEEGNIEIATLPEGDAERFTQIAYDATWDIIRSRAPELGEKLYGLMTGAQ
ncbi:TRAP dicarboxylate transporter subunit DctP [Celeribacter indicus]|uniref:TRAP dicarboxylate transporter subunit DctP n=2 Tax=Celeribacter indicus TaxID=1208324 RepID=A0A0B5DML6_9RHOB|nr:TRAP dicarboxylate transporter subunit DctP [Celeribacter indicus]